MRNGPLAAADIPYKDELGCTVDVHALRTVTGTYLAKGGVSPRLAQAFLRHSDVRLTLGRYTDPKLLDQAAALRALPKLGRRPEREAQRATGTCDIQPKRLPDFLPESLPERGTSHVIDKATADTATAQHARGKGNCGREGNPCNISTYDTKRQRVTSSGTISERKRANGLEPSTFSLEG